MSAAELYDMVMLSSTYELLDRMPDAPRTPILITTPLPPPPKVKAKAIIPKTHKTAATAAAKEALRVAKAAEKAATKEADRLRRALAVAERKLATKIAKKV